MTSASASDSLMPELSGISHNLNCVRYWCTRYRIATRLTSVGTEGWKRSRPQ